MKRSTRFAKITQCNAGSIIRTTHGPIAPHPRWEPDFTYRIKPREPRKWTLKIFKDGQAISIPDLQNNRSTACEIVRVVEILPDENP